MMESFFDFCYLVLAIASPASPREDVQWNTTATTTSTTSTNQNEGKERDFSSVVVGFFMPVQKKMLWYFFFVVVVVGKVGTVFFFRVRILFSAVVYEPVSCGGGGGQVCPSTGRLADCVRFTFVMAGAVWVGVCCPSSWCVSIPKWLVPNDKYKIIPLL